MRTVLLVVCVSGILALGPSACGGGGGGGGGGAKKLFVVSANVKDGTDVALNEIVVLEFSAPVNPKSVRRDTIQIRAGPAFGDDVEGTFAVDGKTVTFYPDLPVSPFLTDSGFQPATDYRVTIPGPPASTTVRARGGGRLRKSFVANFRTRDATMPLFVDNFLDPNPPGLLVTSPADEAVDVPTAEPIELTFRRRPLDPRTVSADSIQVRLLERDGSTVNRVVRGTPVLTQTHDEVKVVWEPMFPLADRATYEIRVTTQLSDLAGFVVPGATVEFTTRDETPRPGAVTLDFTVDERSTIADLQNTTAFWSDKLPGVLAARHTAAGGTGAAGDFVPQADVVVTPDDYPGGVTVETIDGVEADVYHFRSIEIGPGITVRFAPRPGGPNRPAVLLSLKDVVIQGTVLVSGAAGGNGEGTSYSAALPQATGGAAGPGGTDGASTYQGSSPTSAPAADADDVEDGGGGGAGGTASGDPSYSFGGGGGGGGSREAGKAGTAGGYLTKTYNGSGGAGGPSATDRGYDANPERRPNVGAPGGAAGGLGYYLPIGYVTGPGAGGGGGGALTVQSAGDVTVGGAAVIDASGGAGGTSSAGQTYYAGAGGGGGGGSVLVRGTGVVRFSPGAAVDVTGGAGGAFVGGGSFPGGVGGAGGAGYVRVEAEEDKDVPGSPDVEGASGVSAGPVSTGIFAPEGTGQPSVGQTNWIDLGVFEPEMVKPGAADLTASLYNDEVTIWVQMAVESAGVRGAPDLSALDVADADGDGARDDTLDTATLSEWTKFQDIESLNGHGYQLLRVRIEFTLDPNQGPIDPLPFLDQLVVRYIY